MAELLNTSFSSLNEPKTEDNRKKKMSFQSCKYIENKQMKLSQFWKRTIFGAETRSLDWNCEIHWPNYECLVWSCFIFEFLPESPHLIMHIIILYKNNRRADRFRLGRSLHFNRSAVCIGFIHRAGVSLCKNCVLSEWRTKRVWERQFWWVDYSLILPSRMMPERHQKIKVYLAQQR